MNEIIASLVIGLVLGFVFGFAFKRKPTESQNKGIAFVDSDVVPKDMMEVVGRALRVSVVIPFSGHDMKQSDTDILDSIKIK